jgi:hypothetical protein
MIKSVMGIRGVFDAKDRRFPRRVDRSSAHRHAYGYYLGHCPLKNGSRVPRNPACCNPSHLLDETHEENTRRSSHDGGWSAKESGNPNTKLAEKEAREIDRSLCAGDFSHWRLGFRYGVSSPLSCYS